MDARRLRGSLQKERTSISLELSSPDPETIQQFRAIAWSKQDRYNEPTENRSNGDK